MRAADARRASTLEDVDIPHAGDIAPIYLHIVLSEAAAYHAKTLDSRADDYTPNVRMRLEMGRYILAEDYVRALRGRDVLTREVDAALDGRDGLLLPSLPIPAPKLGVADGAARRRRGAGAQRDAAADAALQRHRPSRRSRSRAARTPRVCRSARSSSAPRHARRSCSTLAATLEPYLGPGTSR